MASLESLIRLKTERLSSVPDELLSAIERVQKKVFPDLLVMLEGLERSGDEILFNQNNLNLLSQIQERAREILSGSEYAEVIQEFADQMQVQAGISDELFRTTFIDFVSAGRASQLVTLSQQDAIGLLYDQAKDDVFSRSIYETVYDAVANNASWGETVKNLQQIVTGDSELDGKLLRYAKQVAHDTFAVADRSYTSQVAEELDAEWFFYSGGTVSGTREFCRERHNEYYFYKEIESWADLDWDGKDDQTNAATIYSLAGGYNCRHSIIPVSISVVPREVILKAISDGWYEPSEFEKQELGL